MSAEERVLSLLDSYWFEHGVFTAKPHLSTFKTSPVLDHQVQEEDHQEPESDDKPIRKLNRITTLMRKSYSDQFLSCKDCTNSSDSPSPKSVLSGPQLQTILSGKEVDSFQDSSSPHKQEEINVYIDKTDNSRIYLSHTQERAFRAEPERNRQKGPSIQDKRKGRKSGSRSLSELEFEELKGFMDLGFVFPEDQESMDSRLVSIVPGLQRRGKNVEKSENSGSGEASVSRPYLSEAWDSLEDEKGILNKNQLMDWRIPAFGNEMELKDHLRFWAHTVASTVG